MALQITNLRHIAWRKRNNGWGSAGLNTLAIVAAVQRVFLLSSLAMYAICDRSNKSHFFQNPNRQRGAKRAHIRLITIIIVDNGILILFPLYVYQSCRLFKSHYVYPVHRLHPIRFTYQDTSLIIMHSVFCSVQPSLDDVVVSRGRDQHLSSVL